MILKSIEENNMKKTLVTLMAAITLMGGFTTVATGCSNASTTQKKDVHSAKKITKSEIKGHDYVGVSKDNKDEYITFFTGKDKKDVKYFRVNKDGSKKTITYFQKSKLVMNKDNKKKFKITGFRIIAEPDFSWKFTKVGKTTIKTPDGQKWKLYEGSHKSVVKHVEKNAK
ncbi:hypothetical protein FC72_GL001255 [Companilactobacillus tucceti DSM 20183]|uniref:Lipoprotein n=2 Tax=Companilactobacillus tucceti TaxID=238012 RepID=A0A0R1J4B5_9LACO|nr:hypothetical protein FC72_GL001255 [Companilactobacillus tucceti DSM 20183]